MSERWCKLYPNALTDPTWIAVAAEAGSSRSLVGQTFVELLCWVSDHAPDTGSIVDFDARVWAAWVECPVEEITRIIEALRNFGRIAGERLSNWVRRQGEAAIATGREMILAARVKSTERVRRHRERKRAGGNQLSLLLPISNLSTGAGVSPEVSPEVSSAHVIENADVAASVSAPCNDPGNVSPDGNGHRREEEVDSSAIPKEDEKPQGISQRCAPLDAARAKRANLIKTLRRWARLSPRLAEDERLPRLQMLDRAEFALDDWDNRSPEDKRCFDLLAERARASPLDDQVISWVRAVERPQQRGFRPLGQLLGAAAD